MIVIAEHELMKTELQFATFQGIPVHEANDYKKNIKIQNKTNMVRPEDIKGKLKQWRILFYLDALREIDLKKLLKHTEEEEPLFIQIKLFDYITKFKLFFPKSIYKSNKSNKSITKCGSEKISVKLLTSRTKQISTLQSKFGSLLNKSSEDSGSYESDEEKISMANRNKSLNLKLNKLRVHYFFTEFYEISKFLKNTKIEIRITSGEDWNKVMAVGAIAPFYDMNPDKYDMVQTEHLRVPFLSQYIDDFYITMK